ncbi:unnamed protein product [Pleuronectes platessa]|uniref:Uncharacterized protein n=1 Tax=Pleuronectes platessa TaxID=8262 RepID=A0A9N7Z099_PLEPL|nr:unnamed protein product [Pleuronectes platessa]
MGERNTERNQPGYDGLCNYAQKITSCFGLDGAHQHSTDYINCTSEVTGGGILEFPLVATLDIGYMI